jgi:site-specific DNA-methyltransferase (adenine-specific)
VAVLELLTIKIQQMTIESTNLQNSTNPAITYSECYAQVFSRLFFGDCLIESDKIESGSVDLILTDLPYGTMDGQSKTGIYHNGQEKHEWDSIIDTDKIMRVANRILRKNGKMILFAQEPFTRELINKAIPNLPFNYRAIWLKDTLGSFMRSKSALLYRTEDILIFSKINDIELAHPIRTWLKETQEKVGIFWNDKRLHEAYLKSGIAKNIQSAKVICQHKLDWSYAQIQEINERHYELLNEFYHFDKTKEELKEIYIQYKNEFSSTFNLWRGGKYKDNVFEYKRDRDNLHPTQKPVLLLEDLIKTFSNEGNLVVDLTMGSGSTGVACKNTNRSFIGIEKDENYFKIAEQRINARTLFS